MTRPALILLALLFLAGAGACTGPDEAMPKGPGDSDIGPTPTKAEAQTPTPSPTSTRAEAETPTPDPTPTKTEAQTPTSDPAPTRAEAETPTPDPTPTKTEAQTPTPGPAPTRVKAEIPTPGWTHTGRCSFEFGDEYEYIGHYYNRTVRWSPDGSWILFDFGGSPNKPHPVTGHEAALWAPPDLYAVRTDGSQMGKVVDSSAGDLVGNADLVIMSFDVSPDGSMVAYSECAHTQDDDGEVAYNYEIFLTNIDGTEGRRRLTENTHFDNFPVWSPDGARVAFISDGDPPAYHLAIHTLATGESRDLVLSINHPVAPHPPAWSPDGESIAFVVYEGESYYEPSPAVYKVEVESSKLTRIAEAASGPAWSPDGHRIAVVLPDDRYDRSLYTFAADGSDPVKVGVVRQHGGLRNPWVGLLDWSPDGSAILVDEFTYYDSPPPRPLFSPPIPPIYGESPSLSRGGHRATPRASPGVVSLPVSLPSNARLRMGETSVKLPYFAAWSPDGSRVAVRRGGQRGHETGTGNVFLYVMDRDGENRRDLVEGVWGFDGVGLRLVEGTSE